MTEAFDLTKLHSRCQEREEAEASELIGFKFEFPFPFIIIFKYTCIHTHHYLISQLKTPQILKHKLRNLCFLSQSVSSF